MTDPAQAFLNHGNVDQWTRGAAVITDPSAITVSWGNGSQWIWIAARVSAV